MWKSKIINNCEKEIFGYANSITTIGQIILKT